MSIISAVASPFAQPSGTTTNANTTSNEGDAAQANETTTGTTEAKEAQTDTATTPDDGGANTGSNGAASASAQSYSTAKDLGTAPVEVEAKSTVQAQIETPAKLSAEDAEAAARQAAQDAQAAYKLQAILEGMTSPSAEAEKIAPVAEGNDVNPPATSAEPEEMPV